MRSILKASIFCFAAAGILTAAHAEWPERPITIVVPFSAGGNTDSIARISAEWLSRKFKQSVIVENKPGANGAIAAEFVATANADGYTLFMATLPQMAILPHLQKVKYDPVSSFEPVTIVATNPFALAVASNIPAQNLSELIKIAKSKPGDLAYASAGTGSVSHLSMTIFSNRAGIDLNHLPYKGGLPAISDVLGGQVPMYFGNLAEIIPQYKAGKLKVLAVSSDKRVNQMPDVPTVAEQGYAGYSTYTWNAISAPAGTPKLVTSTLTNAMRSALQDPAFVSKLNAIGVDPLCSTSEEFATILKKDIVQWGSAVRISGAKPG